MFTTDLVNLYSRNIFKTSLYIYIFQDEKCRLMRNLSLSMASLHILSLRSNLQGSMYQFCELLQNHPLPRALLQNHPLPRCTFSYIAYIPPSPSFSLNHYHIPNSKLKNSLYSLYTKTYSNTSSDKYINFLLLVFNR